MAPQRNQIAGGRGRAGKGFVRSTYDTLTSPDNASVVRSVAIFGVVATFLSSSLAETFLVVA